MYQDQKNIIYFRDFKIIYNKFVEDIEREVFLYVDLNDVFILL